MIVHQVTLRFAIACCAIIAFVWTSSTVNGAETAVSFERDVKPVLARRCFRCHSPTAHEGGLRMDQPQSAVAKLDSGLHAIVSGHVEQSALVARITATDESERMPPEGKPLSAEEIAIFKRWIEAGAKWE